MSGIPELHYFDFERGGRAFHIRACLKAANVEYKDVRFSYPEFLELKKEGKYSTGVPLLKLPSGKEVTQSAAILRYAGKLANIYPSDPEQALVCDSIIDTVQDLMSKCPHDPDPEKKKALREEYAAGKMKDYCKVLENVCAGPYSLGSEFSIADLHLFFFTDMLRTGSFDHVPVSYFSENSFSKLLEIDAKIREHPMITEYCKSIGVEDISM